MQVIRSQDGNVLVNAAGTYRVESRYNGRGATDDEAMGRIDVIQGDENATIYSGSYDECVKVQSKIFSALVAGSSVDLKDFDVNKSGADLCCGPYFSV